MYDKGNGGQRDYMKVAHLYRKATERNFAATQYNLGLLYQQGKGVNKNPLKAIALFKQSGQKGLLGSFTGIGNIFYFGMGMPSDYGQAFQWYLRDAYKGYHEAQFRVGMCFGRGYGVERNDIEAYAWFKSSYRLSGKEKAIRATKIVEEKLKPLQLAQANKLYNIYYHTYSDPLIRNEYYYLVCPNSNEAVKVVAVIQGNPEPKISQNVLSAFLLYHAHKTEIFINIQVDDSNYIPVKTTGEFSKQVDGKAVSAIPLLVWDNDNYKELLSRNTDLKKAIHSSNI